MNAHHNLLWNNEILEPVIITYNRAPLLEKTLTSFLESNLVQSRLHVLDNASTDNTAAIVQKIQKQWPNLIYHRNRYNIGGNANILRSVEIAHSTYHWVIGDDDHWVLNPATLNELASVLQAGNADVVRLGWLVSDDSRRALKEAHDLAMQEPMFFASLGMISATIIRRTLVCHYLPIAYQNTTDSYPQLVPLIRAIEESPLKIYTLSQDLIVHTPSQIPGYFCGDLEWTAGWFRTARFFTNPRLKKRFINEVTFYMCRKNPGNIRQWIWLLKVLLYYKSFGLNQWPYLLSMLAYGKGWRIGIFLLMLVNSVTPSRLLSLLRKLYFKIYHLPQKTINVNRSRL